MSKPQFPVNIAAGALVAVLGGLILAGLKFQGDIRWYLLALFLIGTGLAYWCRRNE